MNRFKPLIYPEFKSEEDCKFTKWFSEEGLRKQRCPAEYVVTGIKCSGDYCDNKQLQCCRISGLKMTGALYSSPYFPEEGISFYMNDDEVIVGMKCAGRYCDNISLITRNFKGKGEIWSDSFSEEVGQGMCSSGSYVSGIRCTGSYCDNLRLYCQYLSSDQQQWIGNIPTSCQSDEIAYYKIVSKHSGKCLDIKGHNRDNNANL